MYSRFFLRHSVVSILNHFHSESSRRLVSFSLLTCMIYTTKTNGSVDTCMDLRRNEKEQIID